MLTPQCQHFIFNSNFITMAKGKKSIQGAEKGDILIAKIDVTAYSDPYDYSSALNYYTAGQKIGIIEDILTSPSTKYLGFSSKFDGGWGTITTEKFYLPEDDFSLEFKANPDFNYPNAPKEDLSVVKQQVKPLIVNNVVDETDGGKNTGIRGIPVKTEKDTPDKPSNSILGLTPLVFFSILGGITILVVGLFWMSREDKPMNQEQKYTQSYPQTMMGINQEDGSISMVIPPINLVKK
jgi:hypothetical protein